MAFLHQDRVQNALSAKVISPFKVQTVKRYRCNHNIPLGATLPSQEHRDKLTELMDDSLVRVMLPVPRNITDPIPFVVDTGQNLRLVMHLLSKLSSPIIDVIHPAWASVIQNMTTELSATNVQPFVMSEVTSSYTEKLNRAVSVAITAPRRLIVMGHAHVALPKGCERIETGLGSMSAEQINELALLPWETLGAWIVRQYMRREFNIGSDTLDNAGS